jgi:hypothetical protein
MPLGFNTKSHGEIPVGFFNIETDMFLVQDYFVFASDLCEWIGEWTKEGDEEQEHEYLFYVFRDQSKIGDLMGAIHGVRFTGFIGELYKKYPFPQEKEKFKQNPEGWKTREKVEELIQDFAQKEKVPIIISKGGGTISIGEYVFEPEDFHQILMYISQGGWPKWKDEVQPGYVKEMMKAVISSKHWLFSISEPDLEIR